MTWNLNFRRSVDAQMEAVLALAPDVAVFQEVRAAGFAEMAALLAARGLPHFATSLDHCEEGYAPALGRFVAAASRWPFLDAAPLAAPAPEVAVARTVAGPWPDFELVGLYVPSAARDDQLKIPTQEAVARRIRRAAEWPHILCGDFNSPNAETADGVITPFSRRKHERALAAELGLFDGMVDAFRACNGFGVAESSWYWKNRGRTGGYRLDHILVSRHFAIEGCFYNHDVRLSGLSDHSLMVADLSYR
ncbi:MAG: endonuclease/exonuclease/phosphatase family protein [Dehalococcoidia bacterium]